MQKDIIIVENFYQDPFKVRGYALNELKNNITNYSKLLNTNGIIFGDDFTFARGVKKAVEKYCYENNKQYEVTEGRYWRFL